MRSHRPLIALVALLAAAPAEASVPDLFGYGARAQALAGAVASAPRGHAAVYYNPAGLAFEPGVSFSLGYTRATLDLSLDGAPYHARSASATLMGFGLPLPLGGFMARRLALGAGFVIPTASVLVADVPRPDAPRFVLLESRAQTVSLQAALGLRITDWLAVGAGFLALAELHGAIDVAPNAEGRIGSQARDQLVADYAPVFSALLRLPDGRAALSLSWRATSAADFVLPINANLGDRFPLPVPELDISGTAQYDPEQWGVELSATPVWRLRVATGLSWRRWSRFPNPIVYTAVPVDFPPQPAAHFADTFEGRLGLERPFALTEELLLEVRAGYLFAPSPAPEQSGVHNYLDNDRHLFSTGVGLRAGRLRLDLALQWHHLVDRRHTKDPGRFDGEIWVPEENPGWPTVRHGGEVLSWALELGVEL